MHLLILENFPQEIYSTKVSLIICMFIIIIEVLHVLESQLLTTKYIKMEEAGELYHQWDG